MAKSNKLKIKKIKKHLRCILTDKELLGIGKELAESSNDLNQVENDKKRVVSDFNAKVAEKEAIIAQLSNKISTGYEYRDVDCTVTYHFPKEGFKEIKRNDTSELIETLEMTEAECQEEIEFREAA